LRFEFSRWKGLIGRPSRAYNSAKRISRQSIESVPLDCSCWALIKLEMMQPVVCSIALYELGRTDESDVVLEALIEQHADRYACYIAMVYAWRGDTDTAFHWLNTAIDDNQDLDAIHIEALLQDLHTDPRWEQTLSRVGLASSQVADIEF